MKVKLSDLIIDPSLKRLERAEDESSRSDEYLLESIKNIGLNEPFWICREGDKFKLVDGYRRINAIRELLARNIPLPPGLDINALPAIEIPDGLSAAIARIQSDIRQDLMPSEKARFLQLLLKKHGMKKKDIARFSGWKPPSVANWLVILDCIPEVQKKIDRGDFPMSAGKIFCVLNEEGQRALLKKFKGLGRTHRETLSNQAQKMPNKYFKKSKKTRKSLAQALINAKTGQIQEGRTLRKPRQLLSDDVQNVESELKVLERDREKYMRLVTQYCYEIDVWFRNKSIRNHIMEHHPDIYGRLAEMVEIELG